MRVVFVGLNNDFVKEFAKEFASELKINYMDFDEELNAYLILQKVSTLQTANEEFLTLEELLIKQLLDADNFIMSISNEVYLSNENYKLFENTLTLLMEKKEDDKILINIQKLLKKHCKITIKQDKIEMKKILNIVKG